MMVLRRWVMVDHTGREVQRFLSGGRAHRAATGWNLKFASNGRPDVFHARRFA